VARPQPVLLLPPSEGKALDGDGPPWAAGTMADRGLDRHRRTVLAAARRAGATARRGAGTMPAIERYTGVLYRELDWPSLGGAARRRGATQVRTASGLWGLVAPGDPIPHYRLKASARVGDLGNLASWWRPRLVPVLAGLTAGRVVWDLLPIEHTRMVAWDDPAIAPAQRVIVRFVDPGGQTISHWNKLLKGAVVRWVLEAQPTSAADLRGFEHPLGYRLDPAASSDLGGPVATAVLRAPRVPAPAR
jgi:cytoplasmic iron level regulating protein YaaA (DUF328/UPF0246 family)